MKRKWQPTPVFLPGKPHEQRSLAGYSSKGCKELHTTEQISTRYSIGHNIQYPEIDRDGGEYKKECICVYDGVTLQQKLTEHCKSAILQ